MALKAIFLDKDGTLVENLPYNADPTRMRLMPGVCYGLRALSDAGYALVVVSNQSGVARGYFSEAALVEIARQLDNLLEEQIGVRLAEFYYCPHHPEGVVSRYILACNCRKPAPGMLLQAASDLGIDLSQSWMIGDILDDIEAGNRAGCRSVLVNNGGETEWLASDERVPAFIAGSLDEAADYILKTA
jgi:D,D-heptose 1,7-bisphosphate phosphatase